MHPSPFFAETDRARIAAIVRGNPFGILVSADSQGMAATHIPFDLRETEQGWELWGHLAAGNGQCAGIAAGAEAMAVFSGPHAYVSPSWYAAGPAVPTWNYVAVTIWGRLEVVDDPAGGLEALSAMDPVGFSVAGLDAEYRARMFRGIRAFVLRAERVQAVWKMSQNKSEADRAGVVAALREQGGEGNRAVAELMAADLKS